MQISTLLSNFWSLFTLPSLSLGFAFLLSLAIFVTGITFAVRKKTTGNMPWQSLLLIVLIVTAIAMWITVLPLLEEGGILYKILYGAFYVMESAVADQDYNLFVDALPSASFWRVYTIFLHLLMPITAYGVILVYFLKDRKSVV